jgi:hypothetical protein
MKIYMAAKLEKSFPYTHQGLSSHTSLKVHKHEFFFITFFAETETYGPKGL